MSVLETEWVGFIGACEDPDSGGAEFWNSNKATGSNWTGIIT
jgi:hypothetical protein